MTTEKKGTEAWGSRIGLILAVAGSAVGLGNFLRFPGTAAQNGGGAFMLPYFVALLIVGIPLAWAEWTMGRYGGLCGFNSAPGIFSVLWRNRFSKYLGVLALLIPLGIYMYYIVIEAWCLAYAYYYAVGALELGPQPKEYQAFYASLVGFDEDGRLFSGGSDLWIFVVIAFAVNFALLYRGVSRGIEKFCMLAMPMMLICALGVLVRVLTLTGQERTVLEGLGEMWNPDTKKLMTFGPWLAAAGQIFFSLSVGFGVIVNYASYMRRNDDLVLSSLTACSVNEFFEVCLGGLITIPAAFIFLGPAVTGMSTFGLGFNALPNVFAQMSGGQLVGFCWFTMLFLAAITSSLSMLQPVLAFLEEGFDLPRRASAMLLGLISLMGTGFVAYYSKKSLALDTMDYWVGTVAIVLLAFSQSIIYGWIFGIERGARHAHEGANLRIPYFIQWILKWVTPIFLLVILIGSISDSLRDRLAMVRTEPVAARAVGFVLLLIVGLTIAIHFAGHRWEREGRYRQLPK